jgi:putative ABC transport system substrate-binding protein
MNRRALLAFVMVLVAAGTPCDSFSGKVVRIGLLRMYAPPGAPTAPGPFQKHLLTLGYLNPQETVFETRTANGDVDALPRLAQELVRQNVDVIVAFTNSCGFAAKNATARIPIVVWGAHSAVEAGLIESLARPGANVTGVETQAPETDAKRVALLKEIVPHLSRLRVIYNKNDQSVPIHLERTRRAGQLMNVEIAPLEVSQPSDIAPALASARFPSGTGILTFTDQLTYYHWQPIADFSLAHRVPTICEFRELAQIGCLISYGPTLSEITEIAGQHVIRILKGANPGDLPMQQVTRYELAVNLKTARALNLSIPQSLLVRADEVVQ